MAWASFSTTAKHSICTPSSAWRSSPSLCTTAYGCVECGCVRVSVRAVKGWCVTYFARAHTQHDRPERSEREHLPRCTPATHTHTKIDSALHIADQPQRQKDDLGPSRLRRPARLLSDHCNPSGKTFGLAMCVHLTSSISLFVSACRTHACADKVRARIILRRDLLHLAA